MMKRSRTIGIVKRVSFSIGMIVSVSLGCLAVNAAVVHLDGSPVEVMDPTIKMGDMTEPVTLVNSHWQEVSLGGSQGKFQVVATVLSLDVPQEQAELQKLDILAASLPAVDFYVVSRDLPYKLAQIAINLPHIKLLSAFRSAEFGRRWGTLIASSALKGLDAPGWIMINPQGQLVYRELNQEVTKNVDFAELEETLHKMVRA